MTSSTLLELKNQKYPVSGVRRIARPTPVLPWKSLQRTSTLNLCAERHSTLSDAVHGAASRRAQTRNEPTRSASVETFSGFMGFLPQETRETGLEGIIPRRDRATRLAV